MATREQLIQAGIAADAAGNTDDARAIAGMIQQMDAENASDPQPGYNAPAPVAGASAQAVPDNTATIQPAAPAPRQQSAWDVIGGAAQHALSAATFGMSDRAAAYLDSKLGSRTYQEALALVKAKDAEFSEANPWTSAAATGAGMVMGGGAIGLGAKAAVRGAAAVSPELGAAVEAAGSYLAPQAGAGRLANAGRMAAGGAVVGGAVGAADNLTSGDPSLSGLLTDAGVGAVTGAVAGPVVGAAVAGGAAAARGVANFASERLATGNTWRLLARKLNADPAELQAAMTNYSRHTGQQPSMAQLMDMRQQGVLADMATANPVLGARAAQAAQEAGTSMPAQMAARIEQTTGRPTLTDAGIQRSMVDEPFDRYMGATVAGVARRDMPVQITRADAAMLDDPVVLRAVRASPTLQAKFGDAADAFATNPNVSRYRGMTMGELDALRQDLRSMAMDGPTVARREAIAAADRISALIDRSHRGYGQQLAQYGDAKDFQRAFNDARGRADLNVDNAGAPVRQGVEQEGFAAGTQADLMTRAGKGPSSALRLADELATSNNRSTAMRSAMPAQQVDQLQGMGEAFSRGQRSLNTIAPTRLSEGADDGVASLGHAGASAVMGHMPSAAYHVKQAMRGLRMSPAMQDRIANMLLDPRTTQQGINNLRRAGMQDEAIRAMLNGLRANAAGNAVAGTQQ